MGDGGKSLRRMDESVVVENLRSTLVEVANLCAWRVGEERALNRSEVRVAGRMRYKCSLRSLTVPPTSRNAQYELFKLVHFPGSVYAVAFASAPRTCKHSGLRVQGYGGSPPNQRKNQRGL